MGLFTTDTACQKQLATKRKYSIPCRDSGRRFSNSFASARRLVETLVERLSFLEAAWLPDGADPLPLSTGYSSDLPFL